MVELKKFAVLRVEYIEQLYNTKRPSRSIPLTGRRVVLECRS